MKFAAASSMVSSSGARCSAAGAGSAWRARYSAMAGVVLGVAGAVATGL
jgi:hypothetical protein